MLTTCFGLAACLGASTVTEGTWVGELVAGCDTAGLHSKTVDKKAKAEGATNPDDNLMTCPFKDGNSVPMFARHKMLAETPECDYRWLKRFLRMTAMQMMTEENAGCAPKAVAMSASGSSVTFSDVRHRAVVGGEADIRSAGAKRPDPTRRRS
ncbi:hypothetical protein [Bradyrhizobium iriomotense]|uniref:hypothetical protein n=1 Tax=Bradyrhizobium iriomotense TaxID=441950 RepID=UPI001FE837E6|nr:hypothetical protein [Bradyrhizobium iriomotense]